MSTKVSDYYNVGDIIYEGMPFVRVLHHYMWDRVCANCYASDTSLKKCGSCGTMKYCGKICQKKAWPDHKFECPFLPGYNDYTNQPFVQVIGNVILKLKGKDWKTVTERLMDKEVSFDDLVSHTGTEQDPSLFINFEMIKRSLPSYIGESNVPDDRSLKEIIGKVMYNQFSFKPLNFPFECRALFIGASKFDHSCIPNSTKIFDGVRFTVIATKAIRKKTEKITFAYAPLVVSMDVAKYSVDMNRMFFEGCKCIDCSQPFGESTLSKVIDMPRAIPVLEETQATLLLVTLLHQLKYPIGIVTRDRLKELLQKQEGLLGKTNLLRMRTLALRCLFLHGPLEDIRRELIELEEAMISAWGENFEELVHVYQKLVEVNTKLGNIMDVTTYFRKANKLFFSIGTKEAQVTMKTMQHFMFRQMRNAFNL